MRSHEERVAETKRRIAKIERAKRRRRNTVTMASAVAACLALLIGASLAMPGIAANIQTGDYSGFETAASIFHGGAALGYIVIGLLAEEVIRTEERNRILHFCMSEMNPDYREVLYLTYFEDMSYAQAAEVTGKTVKQITNMVYRGKESLRRLLEREGIINAES